MRHILISTAALLLFGCATALDASGARSMAVRQGSVELKSAPVTVALKLGSERDYALEVARDPNRHLMLRIEGISVQGEVGVWEVRIGDKVAGTLSTYGAEEENGRYIAAVKLDDAAEPVLRGGADSLNLIFAPTAKSEGTIRFQRLTLVAE